MAYDLDEQRFGVVHDPAVALVHSMAGHGTAKLVMVDGIARVVAGIMQDSQVRDEEVIGARMVTMAARLRAWLA